MKKKEIYFHEMVYFHEVVYFHEMQEKRLVSPFFNVENRNPIVKRASPARGVAARGRPKRAVGLPFVRALSPFLAAAGKAGGSACAHWRMLLTQKNEFFSE